MTFKGVQKLAPARTTPKATAVRRGWREVLPAAALEGAVHTVVKTAPERSVVAGMHKLTGVWTDESGWQPEKAE